MLAIILLVVLSGVAVTGQLEVQTVGRTTFFVGIFVVAVFVAGKLLAPIALRLLHRFGNNETVTLFTVALILAVSLLAAEFEFSLALGGFISGAILSRSSLADEIEELTAPLRDFFCALFFVSVGTLIDPTQVLKYWNTILVVTALVIFGKFVTCWLGFVLGGVPPRVSTRASLAKVQIGEFAFIIAALGLSLRVTNPSVEAIASGVAVLTILFTPLAVASGEFIIETSARFVPKPILQGIKLYHGWSEAIRLSLQGSLFLKTAKRPFTHIIVYFLLLNALIIAASFAAIHMPFGDDPVWRMHGQRLVWVAAALLSIPAQVAVLRNINAITMILSEVSLGWSVLRPLAKGPPRELFRWGLFSVVFFVYAAVFLIACSRYFPTGASLIAFVGVFALFALIFWRRAIHVQSVVEYSLQEAMRQHGGSVVKASVEEAINRISRKNPWPVVTAEVEIPKGAAVAGKTIRDLNLRAATGTTITSIERGGVVHFDVTPAFPVSPGDTLVLLGEQSQIAAAKNLLRETRSPDFEEPAEKQSFAKVLVTAASDLCGLSLKESNIRTEYNVTVVGIQRGERRFTGPGPNETLADGDLLLVMGAPANTERLGDALAGLDSD